MGHENFNLESWRNSLDVATGNRAGNDLEYNTHFPSATDLLAPVNQESTGIHPTWWFVQNENIQSSAPQVVSWDPISTPAQFYFISWGSLFLET